MSKFLGQLRGSGRDLKRSYRSHRQKLHFFTSSSQFYETDNILSKSLPFPPFPAKSGEKKKKTKASFLVKICSLIASVPIFHLYKHPVQEYRHSTWAQGPQAYSWLETTLQCCSLSSLLLNRHIFLCSWEMLTVHHAWLMSSNIRSHTLLLHIMQLCPQVTVESYR